MVAMVEVDLNSCPNGGQMGGDGGAMNASSDDKDCTPVPAYILVMFAGVTTVLISVYLFALMVATCILPNLQVSYYNTLYLRNEPSRARESSKARNMLNLCSVLCLGPRSSPYV